MMSLPGPLYPVLRLERVDRQLYRPFASEEFLLDITVDAKPEDHTHSPKKLTCVSLTSPAQLTPPTSSSSGSPRVSQRRRKVPKRMADGEIFTNPRKRTKIEITNLALNRNHNNSMFTGESCDNRVTVASQPSSDPVAPPTQPKKECGTSDIPLVKRPRGRPRKKKNEKHIKSDSESHLQAAAKQVIQAFKNDQALPSNSTSSVNETSCPSLSSSDHIYLPVFSNPTPPPECHTPIIITNEVGMDYSNSIQESVIQIQENVDNLLSQDTVRLLETVLGDTEVGVVNMGVVPKENKACPLGAEFPLETEELLGPWSEVLSDVNRDLHLLVQDDQINGLLTDLTSDPAHSCCGPASSINDHQDKPVTMTTVQSSSTSPPPVFPYSKDVVNLNLNDCVDVGEASWFMGAESELINTREVAIGGDKAVSVATATNERTSSSLNGYVLRSSLATSETTPLAANQNEPTSGDCANELLDDPVAMVTTLPIITTDEPVSITTPPIVATETHLITNGVPSDKCVDTVDHTHFSKPSTKGPIRWVTTKKGNTPSGNKAHVVKKRKELVMLKCMSGSATPTCVASATPTKVSPPINAKCQLSVRKVKTPTKSPSKTAPFSLDDSYSEDSNLIIDVEGVACNRTGDVPQGSSPVKRVLDSSNDVISNDVITDDAFTFNLNKLAMNDTGPVASGNQTIPTTATPTTVLPSVYSKLDPSHRIRVPLFMKPLQMFTPPPTDHTSNTPLSDQAHKLGHTPNGFSFGNVDLPVSSVPGTPIRAESPVQTPPTSPAHLHGDSSNTSSSSISLTTPPGEVMIDGANKISLFVDETIDDMDDSNNSNATKNSSPTINSNFASDSNVTKISNVAIRGKVTTNSSIVKNSNATNVTNIRNIPNNSNASNNSFKQVQKWVVAQRIDPPPPLTTTPTHILPPPVPSPLSCQPIGCGIWTTPRFVPPSISLTPGCHPIPPSFFVPPLTSCPFVTPPLMTTPPPSKPRSVSKWSGTKPVNKFSSFNPSLPPTSSPITQSNELDLLKNPPTLNPESVIELGLIDPSLLNLPFHNASLSINKYLAEPSNKRVLSSRQNRDLLLMLKDLLHNDYNRASSGFMSLCVDSGIQFSARVLTSLLFLCTRQTRVLSPAPVLVAGRVYSDLCRLYGGRVSYVHHIHYLRTLASYNEINLLFAVYGTAEQVGVAITPPHLDTMLGKAKLLGNRMMKVLNDAKLCLTPDALVRFSERVFDLVNLAALSSQPQALIGWIRNNPGTTRLLPIHQTRCFLRVLYDNYEQVQEDVRLYVLNVHSKIDSHRVFSFL